MNGIFNKTFFRFLFRFVVLVAVGLMGAFASSIFVPSSQSERDTPQANVRERPE